MEPVTLLEIEPEGSIPLYLLAALGGSLFVRTVVSMIRSCRVAGAHDGQKFWSTFEDSFVGTGIEAGDSIANNDYWIPFWIGFLELISFPVLLAAGKPSYIAGWFVLKTIPRWQEWTETRHVYNQFLIGSATVIILSYFLARFFF